MKVFLVRPTNKSYPNAVAITEHGVKIAGTGAVYAADTLKFRIEDGRRRGHYAGAVPREATIEWVDLVDTYPHDCPEFFALIALDLLQRGSRGWFARRFPKRGRSQA